MQNQPAGWRQITFVGAGNMAEALIGGLLREQRVPASGITVTDIQDERRAHLERVHGVNSRADNREAVASADIVVLAVKPQSMPDVLTDIRDALGHRPVLISIAAGISVAAMESLLGAGARLVRSMPNTPALIGKGITAICSGGVSGDAELVLAEQVLGACGKVVRVSEQEMDAVTAISGSGPAYVFYLMEAMLEAGQRLGLDDELARALVCQTVEGAAGLVAAGSASPADLRARVTSKGGTTAAALSVMEAEDVFDHLVTAILAAYERSKELSARG